MSCPLSVTEYSQGYLDVSREHEEQLSSVPGSYTVHRTHLVQIAQTPEVGRIASSTCCCLIPDELASE
jgi:hypothetical protein